MPSNAITKKRHNASQDRQLPFRLHKRSPLALALLSALFLSFSFPPFPLPLLQIPAFFGLMQLATRPIPLRSFLGYSYLSMVLWNLCTTYWLMMAHVGAGVGAILANAAVMLIPLIAIRAFLQSWTRGRGLSGVVSAICIASTWTGYEFLHHRWDLAWPWLSLGNAWSQWIPLVQYISVTGILGITFWVVFGSALLYIGIATTPESVEPNPSTRNKLQPRLRSSIVQFALLLFVLPPALSLMYYSFASLDSGLASQDTRPVTPDTHLTSPDSGTSMTQVGPHEKAITPRTGEVTAPSRLEIVIVQPNSDSYQPLGGHPSLTHLTDHLLELTRRARTDSTDLILWPENALDTTLSLQNGIIQRLADSTRAWNTSLVTGAGYLKTYPSDPSDPSDPSNPSRSTTPLLNRQSEGGIRYNIYNAALFLGPDGVPPERDATYLKGRLVPFVERFPFANFLFRLDHFGWIPWERFFGYGLGTEPLPFTLPSGDSFPALICYDSVFPGWVNRFAGQDSGQDSKQGSGQGTSFSSGTELTSDSGRNVGFIAIITNDGWWGDSAGHVQHFEYARLRAVEHRQWVVRSANNGISGAINPRGQVVHKTEYWTEDAFRQTITTHPYPTLYARYGDWVGGISLLFVLFGLMRLRYRPKQP